MKKIIFVIIALFFFLETVYGKTAITVDNKRDLIFCNPHVTVLEDPGRNFSFESVINSDSFSRQNSLNLGITSSQYWMKFTVSVPDNNKEKLFLVIPNPKLDLCEIFIPDKGRYRSVTMGDHFTYGQKNRDFHLFSAEINSVPGEYTYYLRARNSDWFVVPLFMFTEQHYESFKNRSNLLDGLLYGALLVMFLYFFIIGISTKDNTNILFSLYVLSALAYEFISIGHFREYIMPHSMVPDHIPYTVALIASALFLFFFKSYLFSDKTGNPVMVQAIAPIGSLTLLVSFVTFFIPVKITVQLNALVSMIVFAVLIWGGLYALIKKNRQAYFLMAALSVSTAGSIVFYLLWGGLLPLNTFTLRAFPVSFILMLSLLALGMADKVNMVNRENIRLAKLEKKYEMLKYKVLQERTNPHFLFNALATLNSIMKRDIVLAEKAILSLSGIYRFLTDSASRELISLDEEMNFITSYLDFEKITYVSDLSAEVIAEGSFKDIMIPPLTVQPFVRNAIKHGLEKYGGKEHVTVIAKNKNNLISIEVLDDGPGLEKEDIYSRTIGNITELLKYHYKSSRVIVANRREGGVRACIEIPVKDRKL